MLMFKWRRKLINQNFQSPATDNNHNQRKCLLYLAARNKKSFWAGCARAEKVRDEEMWRSLIEEKKKENEPFSKAFTPVALLGDRRWWLYIHIECEYMIFFKWRKITLNLRNSIKHFNVSPSQLIRLSLFFFPL